MNWRLSLRSTSATKIGRPQESIAETQPPTPTGFAEIVSDYFRSTLSFTSWMSAFALFGPL